MNTNISVTLFEEQMKKASTMNDFIKLNRTLSELYGDDVITDVGFEEYCLVLFNLIIIGDLYNEIL